jgi:hypothetical protein
MLKEAVPFIDMMENHHQSSADKEDTESYSRNGKYMQNNFKFFVQD